MTSQSYRPLEVPDGTYPLPWNMHQTSSGYSREKPSAATPTKEVSAGLGATPGWGGGEGEPKAGVEEEPKGRKGEDPSGRANCTTKGWSRLR